jgi:hypothetical protein
MFLKCFLWEYFGRKYCLYISVFGCIFNRNFGRNRKIELNRNRNRNAYRNRNFGRNRNRNRKFPITTLDTYWVGVQWSCKKYAILTSLILWGLFVLLKNLNDNRNSFFFISGKFVSFLLHFCTAKVGYILLWTVKSKRGILIELQLFEKLWKLNIFESPFMSSIVLCSFSSIL